MWGLIIGVVVALIAVGLLVEGILNGKYFLGMLIIAVAVGSVIAHFGSTKKFKATMTGIEIERFEDAANEITKKKLDEIDAEVAGQKKQLTDVVVVAKETRKELEKVAEAAAPPLLSLSSKPDIRKTGEGGYQVLLEFEPSKNAPFGTVVFSADILEGNTATLRPLQTKMLCFSQGHSISEDAKTAKTQYVPAKPEGQILVLNVSEPCKVRISCSHMKGELELEIK